MNKTKILCSAFLIAVSFISCDKKDDEISSQDIIIGKWKLSGLVNISDQDKYLETILEFQEGNLYTNNESTGENITNGNWSYLKDNNYIVLSNGIFNDDLEEFRIMQKNSESLKLEYHYTLDNKDAILEYHYTRVN